MKPWTNLRARAAALQSEIAELEHRIVAIECRDYRDQSMAVPTRLRGFLGAFHPMAFSPAELMEAIAARDESLRKALWRLHKAKLVERVAWGQWRAVLDV